MCVQASARAVDAIVQLCAELKGQVVEIIFHACGTHPFRALVSVLAGMDAAEPSKDDAPLPADDGVGGARRPAAVAARLPLPPGCRCRPAALAARLRSGVAVAAWRDGPRPSRGGRRATDGGHAAWAICGSVSADLFFACLCLWLGLNLWQATPM